MGIGRIEGRAGCIHVSSTDGTVTNLSCYALIVQEDTVISELRGSDGENLLLSSYTNLSGKTLKAGAYVTIPDSTTISSITLSSGSVILYKYLQGATD